MSSPPPSPSRSFSSLRSPLSPRLSVHGISTMFLGIRRTKDRSKAHHICCTSGPEPITTPSLAQPDAVSVRKIPLIHSDRFVCAGAVDLQKLLRASRASLYDNAENLGANVLIDEQSVQYLVFTSHMLTRRADGPQQFAVQNTEMTVHSGSMYACLPFNRP